MTDFSKSERKLLRELAATVYEAEAHKLLEELDLEFGRWRRNEIFSSELLSEIHDFHQQHSRQLWSMYQSLKEPEIVSRGVAFGFIQAEALGPLRAELEPLIEFYRGHAE